MQSLSRKHHDIFHMTPIPSVTPRIGYKITRRAGDGGTRLSFQEQFLEQYCRVFCHNQKAAFSPCCFPCKQNGDPMWCLFTSTELRTHCWDLSYICHWKTTHLYTRPAQKQLYNVNIAFHVSQGYQLSQMKKLNYNSLDKNAEKLEHLCIVGENIKWCCSSRKQNWGPSRN